MKNEQLLKEAEMERLVRMVQPKSKRSLSVKKIRY
jgi:hypothetical protein